VTTRVSQDGTEGRALRPVDLRSRLQFLHPERLLELWDLPQQPQSDVSLLSAIFGTNAQAYEAMRAEFRGAVHQAANEVLETPAVREAVERLPIGEGETVVAVGDSITDDYQSWAEILRAVLSIKRPNNTVSVVNAGISGDTTFDVLRRSWKISASRPDWVIALIGTNDARRDRATGEMLVSHAETERNLRLIRCASLAAGSRRVVWITPPPVLEDRIERDERASARGVFWLNKDIEQKALLVRRQPDIVADVAAAFLSSPIRDLLLPDGLHPSLNGQKCIFSALVRTLASCG